MTKLRDEILAEVRPMLAAVAAVAGGKVRAALPRVPHLHEEFKGDVALGLQEIFRQKLLMKIFECEAEAPDIEEVSGELSGNLLDLAACATTLDREYARGYNDGIRAVQALLHPEGFLPA